MDVPMGVIVIAEATDAQQTHYARVISAAEAYDRYEAIREMVEQAARYQLAEAAPLALAVRIEIIRTPLWSEDD